MCHNSLTERTALLLGEEAVQRLGAASVLVVGVGGVGAYAAEMICRAGIGSMTIVDADCVAPSNINRQLPALTSTVGQEKVNVLGKRLNDINPALNLRCMAEYVDAESVLALLDGGKFDFIVDAIDTISPKVSLICGALDRKIPIISSMGAGAKTDISKIRTADVWETYNCGLSRAVRQALKKRGYSRRKLPVVFSTEPPDMQAVMAVTGERNKNRGDGELHARRIRLPPRAIRNNTHSRHKPQRHAHTRGHGKQPRKPLRQKHQHNDRFKRNQKKFRQA